jgi:hypothetical protein
LRNDRRAARGTGFPLSLFPLSSFWFLTLYILLSAAFNPLPIRPVVASIAGRLLPALLKRRPNSQHMEAKFYLALGSQGCELRLSKISDRTRPFI